jgi:hypothetical protein
LEDGDRQNDVTTVLGKLGVGVRTGYNQHRQRSKAGFSEQSNENLDTDQANETKVNDDIRRRVEVRATFFGRRTN